MLTLTGRSHEATRNKDSLGPFSVLTFSAFVAISKRNGFKAISVRLGGSVCLFFSVWIAGERDWHAKPSLKFL